MNEKLVLGWPVGLGGNGPIFVFGVGHNVMGHDQGSYGPICSGIGEFSQWEFVRGRDDAMVGDWATILLK
jgi:hypothetical protein